MIKILFVCHGTMWRNVLKPLFLKGFGIRK